MSKIVVDKMPEKPGDCPYNLGYLCGIKETPCDIHMCDKLTSVDIRDDKELKKWKDRCERLKAVLMKFDQVSNNYITMLLVSGELTPNDAR